MITTTNFGPTQKSWSTSTPARSSAKKQKNKINLISSEIFHFLHTVFQKFFNRISCCFFPHKTKINIPMNKEHCRIRLTRVGENSLFPNQKTQEPRANPYLDKMWQDYRNSRPQSSSFCHISTLIRAIENTSNRSNSYGMTDPNESGILSNPFLHLRPAKGVFVIPQIKYTTNDSFIQNDLSKTLNEAFTSGYETVIGRFGNGIHAFVMVFQVDGTCTLVDSMFNHSIDMQKTLTTLNRTVIKNTNGARVLFNNGSTINTKLQKGGNHCLFFATLYAIRIAETGDLEAYKEVNGAFLEGKLKTFEDISKIPGSRRISEAPTVQFQDYVDFMKSWVCRCYGYSYDHMNDIPIKKITEHLRSEDSIEMNYFDQHGNISSKSPLVIPGRKLFICTQSGKEMDLFSEEVLKKDELYKYQEKTIGDLIQTHQRWLLINEKIPSTKSYLIPLNPGDQLIQKVTEDDHSIQRILVR